MGRSLLGIATVLATACTLSAQPPGNVLVIRPKSPAAEADKPGFITVRPKGSGGKTQLVASGGQPPAAKEVQP